MVKVYFASGKTDVVPDFAAAAGGLKAYLASHPGSSLGVTGFADPTGNAAYNIELSKQRAQAVKAALSWRSKYESPFRRISSCFINRS